MVAAGAGRLAVTIKTGDTAMTIFHEIFDTVLDDIERDGVTPEIRSTASMMKRFMDREILECLMSMLQSEGSFQSRSHFGMLASTLMASAAMKM